MKTIFYRKKRFPWWLILMDAVFILFFLGVFLSPLDPEPFSAPEAPKLTGPLGPNDRLLLSQILPTADCRGPESVAFDWQGRIYSGCEDGRVIRLGGDGKMEIIAHTRGRPLGLAFNAQGALIIADAEKGLLEMAPSGDVKALATQAGGVAFRYTDDVTIARDGMIYFTDASSKYGPADTVKDVLEAKPNGRLIAYDPKTQAATVILENLYFANGVALSPDEDFILINETSRYRVIRYWLSGRKKGTHEVFAENLPGFPDGIAPASGGGYWIAFFTVRDAFLDRVHDWVWAKKLMGWLPKSLLPAPEAYGLVAKLDREGQITDNFHDPLGQHVKEITSAEERDGFLILGNLSQPWIARLKL